MLSYIILYFPANFFLRKPTSPRNLSLRKPVSPRNLGGMVKIANFTSI